MDIELLPKHRCHAQAVKLYEREQSEDYFFWLVEFGHDENDSTEDEEDNVYLNSDNLSDESDEVFDWLTGEYYPIEEGV